MIELQVVIQTFLTGFLMGVIFIGLLNRRGKHIS